MTVGLLGRRVRLRPLRADDRGWLLALEQDVAGGLHHRAGAPEPWGDDGLDAYLERHRDSLLLAVETVAEHRPIGRVLLKNHDAKNQHAELGIALAADGQGSGYGTEAVALMVDFGFRHWDLHKVKLDVDVTNERAVAVYRKLGFRIDARQREARYRDGRLRDLLDMSLLRSEWADRRGNWVP